MTALQSQMDNLFNPWTQHGGNVEFYDDFEAGQWQNHQEYGGHQEEQQSSDDDDSKLLSQMEAIKNRIYSTRQRRDLQALQTLLDEIGEQKNANQTALDYLNRERGLWRSQDRIVGRNSADGAMRNFARDYNVYARQLLRQLDESVFVWLDTKRGYLGINNVFREECIKLVSKVLKSAKKCVESENEEDAKEVFVDEFNSHTDEEMEERFVKTHAKMQHMQRLLVNTKSPYNWLKQCVVNNVVQTEKLKLNVKLLKLAPIHCITGSQHELKQIQKHQRSFCESLPYMKVVGGKDCSGKFPVVKIFGFNATAHHEWTLLKVVDTRLGSDAQPEEFRAEVWGEDPIETDKTLVQFKRMKDACGQLNHSDGREGKVHRTWWPIENDDGEELTLEHIFDYMYDTVRPRPYRAGAEDCQYFVADLPNHLKSEHGIHVESDGLGEGEMTDNKLVRSIARASSWNCESDSKECVIM